MNKKLKEIQNRVDDVLNDNIQVELRPKTVKSTEVKLYNLDTDLNLNIRLNNGNYRIIGWDAYFVDIEKTVEDLDELFYELGQIDLEQEETNTGMFGFDCTGML